MFKLLVSTDFSENSKAGIRFALQLASQTKVDIEFYHVIEIIKPTSWSEKRFKFLAQERIKKYNSRLRSFVSKIIHQCGHEMGNYHFMSEVGIHPSTQIMLHAKKIKADYICMSTHGAGKLRKIFGTHASNMVTTSSIPVIVVPKGYRTKPIKKIFYASDFANLPREIRMVEKFAQPLHCLTNVFHFDYLLHVAENRKKLENKAAKYKSNLITFTFIKQDIENSLGEHLKKHIQKTKPDVVALVTKPNRNWYDRLFLNINSAEMTFHTKTPLLVFRKRI